MFHMGSQIGETNQLPREVPRHSSGLRNHNCPQEFEADIEDFLFEADCNGT